ncbi:uncharacterized protein LOC141573310 [Camelus bactrianus]|uniref:Uncharacterized protein LOC141573310 n=1 Tax=Camelus bactrianus TaxID=9837 RepID=A0AC58PG49_CAMBA
MIPPKGLGSWEASHTLDFTNYLIFIISSAVSLIALLLSTGSAHLTTPPPPIRAHRPTIWPVGVGEGSRASRSREGHALAAQAFGTRPLSSSNPAGQGAPGPRCARWRGCQARPSRGRLSQPPNYAAEPGRPARLPPQLSGAAPEPGASPRPRRPGGSGRGAAREHLGWARVAGAALPELRAGSRSPPPGAAAAARRPSDSAASAAAAWQQTRCGQPAGTGQQRPRAWNGRVRTERARPGETPAPGIPCTPCRASPAPLPARGASPGGRGGLGGGAGREDRLRPGRGFPAPFRVHFQRAKCSAPVSAPWISLSRVGV